MRGLLALAALVLAADPSFWVEREGEVLRVTADLSPLLDRALAERLRSGLTTTLRLRLTLRTWEDGSLRGELRREARVRWDLWDERLRVQIVAAEPGPGPRDAADADVEAFAAGFTRVDRVPIAAGIPLDDQVYTLDAVLEVNPFTTEQLARMRRWMSPPGRSPGEDDPLARGLLGTFLQLFDNLRPAGAERTLRASAHPFRGDRLPLWRPPEAP